LPACCSVSAETAVSLQTDFGQALGGSGDGA